MVVQAVKEFETGGEQAMEKRFDICDSVDSAILTNVKIMYSYWLPVVLALKGIPVFVFYPYFDIFWFRMKYRFILFYPFHYRCKFVMRSAR
jgi:hypothetical protein